MEKNGINLSSVFRLWRQDDHAASRRQMSSSSHCIFSFQRDNSDVPADNWKDSKQLTQIETSVCRVDRKVWFNRKDHYKDTCH